MRANSDGTVHAWYCEGRNYKNGIVPGRLGAGDGERHLQEPVGQGRPLRRSLHEVRVGRLHVVQRRRQPDHRLAAGELQPGLRRQLHLQARQRELAPGARHQPEATPARTPRSVSGTTTATQRPAVPDHPGGHQPVEDHQRRFGQGRHRPERVERQRDDRTATTARRPTTGPSTTTTATSSFATRRRTRTCAPRTGRRARR